MIGLACSLLAAGSAALVARKAPRHTPLAAAFTASAGYAGAVEAGLVGRPALLMLAAIPTTTAIAYLLAWRAPRWELAAVALGAVALALWILLAPSPASWWTAATWGPYAAACAVGLVAWLRWRRASPCYISGTSNEGRSEADITQRIALAVLAGDVGGLLLARYPGVVEWEGRAMALAIAAFQVWWLLNPTGRRDEA